MVSTNLGGGHHGRALHRSGSQPNPRPQEQWPQHVPRGSEARAGATVSAARRVAGGDRSGSWPEPQPAAQVGSTANREAKVGHAGAEAAGGHGTALAASGGGEDPGPDGSPWTVAAGYAAGHYSRRRQERRRTMVHSWPYQFRLIQGTTYSGALVVESKESPSIETIQLLLGIVILWIELYSRLVSYLRGFGVARQKDSVTQLEKSVARLRVQRRVNPRYGDRINEALILDQSLGPVLEVGLGDIELCVSCSIYRQYVLCFAIAFSADVLTKCVETQKF